MRALRTLTLSLALALPGLALAGEPPATPPAAADQKLPAEAAPQPTLQGAWPGDEKTVSLDFDKRSTRDALKALAKEAGWSIAFQGSVRGKVDMALQDLPADRALELVLKQQHLVARREGNLVTIRGEDESESAALDKKPERANVGGSVKVGENETVRTAVAVLGDVTVDGTVLDDTVAVFGDVTLGPKAVVKGDVVTVFGKMRIDPGASVGGNKVGVFSSAPAAAAVAPALGSRLTEPLEGVVGFAGKVLQYIVYFVIGLLMLTFIPGRVRSVAHEIGRAPALCFGIGFAGSIAVVPLVILLAAIVVGIPLIPVLLLGIVAAVMLGFTSLAVEIGRRFPMLAGRPSQIAVLGAGTAVLFFVSLLPFFLGYVALWAASVLVFGAVLRTKFGALPAGTDANYFPDWERNSLGG